MSAGSADGHAKVPAPHDPLTLEEEHVVGWTGALWRIHRTGGRHPSDWNQLRTVGPLESMRWDAHPRQALGAPLPLSGTSTPTAPGAAGDPRSRPSVSYAAATPDGAFAEVFQEDRIIELHPDRALSSWIPTRELRLLDLSDSDFGVHNGAAHVLPSVESRALTRQWARAIFGRFGDRIDGLTHRSTMIGDPVVVLFARAQDSFPEAPAFSRPLDHVDVAAIGVAVGARLRWPVV